MSTGSRLLWKARVLTMIYHHRNISYFFLLADSIGQRPPRIHRVENLLEKLWAYAHKFQNLEMKLTVSDLLLALIEFN